MTEYPWYTTVSGDAPLEQGDFFSECPIIIPSSKVEPGKQFAKAEIYNVVVLSQSCDLEHDKLDLVLVCPIWPLNDIEKRNDFLKSKNGKNALRQGNLPNYHLLNKCGIRGFESDYIVVSFRDVFGIPFNYLVSLANTDTRRLRLLTPYKEHLSQAFAKFFMRVALPIDIPPFK